MALTREAIAATEATTTRADFVASACRARARAEVTSRCGAISRYGSISSEGHGSTTRSALAALQPSSVEAKKRMSQISGSMSRSAGTTTSTGERRAAAAIANALAGGVTPDRCCGPGSSPAR
jgi:hypothetical protein